ncbi:serine hydrolase domain-containing protein [Polaribacter uvawellassae]|uniref:serine hydrolase domain-containing protein n=1 Tax=Polaribacter uvawellassae TaxID=3133495 RepID=UPI003219BBC0
MKLSFKLLLLIILATTNLYSQVNIKDYEGQWEGVLPKKNTFNLKVNITKKPNNKYLFKLSNDEFSFENIIASDSKKNIQFEFSKGFIFSAIISDDSSEINGFISSNFHFYHIKLTKKKDNSFQGKWNLFIIDELISQSMFFSIENINGQKFEAYPFFGDKRFAGTWAGEPKKKNNIITFQDNITGLDFKGKLLTNKIELEIILAGKTITTVVLHKSKSEWAFDDFSTRTSIGNKPLQLNDGWRVSNLKSSKKLQEMERDILSKKLIKTHSILIAKKGKLVYEKYFGGFTHNTPHDQRSASKSISSALIGIAIDKKLIKNDSEYLYNFIPKNFQYTKDSLKSLIKISDLLTMSSGLDAVDFGTERKSLASEPAYQNSSNWLKTVLEAPMINKPGAEANYGSANPYLLGVSLNTTLEQPLELFIDQQLLKPLGISNYIIQKDRTGIPYFGGGMHITPRDMLKFGQLYLDNGKWNGKRIISKKWIKKSFKNYRKLQNTNDKNGYGYLWWHKTYKVGKQEIKSIEARGAGGQYIFVIPTLDVVVVITSGNYRNGKFQQPEKILENYILPTLLKTK